MQIKVKTIIKYGISLALAIVILMYAFKNVDLNDFISKVSEVSFSWVVFSVFLSLVSHWLRAYRWNILLKPVGHELKSSRTFLAVMTGYLANLAFPRIGEVTRCAVLKKNDGVPMTTSFGTVITERIIDFFILLFLIFFDFVFEFNKVFDFFSKTLKMEKLFENKTIIAAGIVSLILLGILGVYLLRKFLQHESDTGFIGKIRGWVRELTEGLLSLRKIENAAGFVYSTIGIWVLYYLMSYVIVFSIPETADLGFMAGLSILVAGGIGMAMPVQGGIGAYHALVAGILFIYGIQQETGLFFATLLHASQVVSILFFGGVCVLISAFISKNKSSTSHDNGNQS